MLDTIENIAADKLRTKKSWWKSYGAKSTVKCKQLMKRRVEDIASAFREDGTRRKKDNAEFIYGAVSEEKLALRAEIQDDQLQTADQNS